MARPRTIVPGLNDDEGGRPFTMDRQIPGPDGTPQTVGDVILDHIRRGYPLREACAITGQITATVHQWLYRGARATTLQAANPNHQLSETDQKCANFRLAYTAARANIIGDYLGVADEIARGGRRIVETKVEREHDGTDQPGRVVRSTTTTKVLPPNLAALQYRLTILDAARFSPKVTVDVGVEGDPSEDEQAVILAESFAEFLEAEGVEVEPGGPQRAIEAPETAV